MLLLDPLPGSQESTVALRSSLAMPQTGPTPRRRFRSTGVLTSSLTTLHGQGPRSTISLCQADARAALNYSSRAATPRRGLMERRGLVERCHTVCGHRLRTRTSLDCSPVRRDRGQTACSAGTRSTRGYLTPAARLALRYKRKAERQRGYRRARRPTSAPLIASTAQASQR
jgi:hypothetical protein